MKNFLLERIFTGAIQTRTSLTAALLLVVGFLPPARAAERIVPDQYPTIQLAVDAASSGDTIRIAPGVYQEQVVVINKGSLTFVGEPGAVIRAFSTMVQTIPGQTTYPLVAIVQSEAVLAGLTFDGARLGDSYNGFFGILFRGSSGQVTNCIIRGFRGITMANGRGINVNNYVALETPSINVHVVNNTFADNLRSIFVSGDDGISYATLLRTSFTIEGNTFTGFGPASQFAHVGVFISVGAGGEVKGNTMTGYSYAGPFEEFSSAILGFDGLASVSRGYLPLRPVRHEGNIFATNDHHIVMANANDSQVANNIFQGGSANPPQWGALALSGTNVAMANNDFSDLPTGIVLFGDEYLFANWPTVGPAENARLDANWFCNVPEPIRVNTNLVIGFQEHGTQRCENGPLQPVFQSIRNRDGTGAALALRGWHGDSVLIESSANLETNLVNWVPIFTNTMSLPTFDFHDTNDVGAAQRFFRAVKP